MIENKMTLRARASSVVLAMILLGLTACASTPPAGDADPAAGTLTGQQAIDLGDEAARRGDFERALVYYLRAVTIEETADAWFRVAAASSELGNSERALVAYLKVVDLDAMHAGAHEGAGLEYMALKNAEAARGHLTKAVELDAQNWRAHNALGVLADQAADHATAMQHYQAAVAINRDSPMLLNNLGYSRYLAGDLDQAARDFYHVTQIYPDYKPAWSNLAIVYAHRGWYADAVSMLARVMDTAKAYNDVGFVAYRNGDWTEAEQLLGEAVRLSPVYYRAAHQNLELVRAKLAEDAAKGAAPASLVGSYTPPPAVRGDEG